VHVRRHQLLIVLALPWGLGGCSIAVAPEPLTAQEQAAMDRQVDFMINGPLTIQSPATPPTRLRLRVLEDGCGVQRGGTLGDQDYSNLSWTFRDRTGATVLARVADHERRYRYPEHGTYTVTLESFVNGAYARVSNRVDVTC
jgi:hypothetical protein